LFGWKIYLVANVSWWKDKNHGPVIVEKQIQQIFREN
jgi:hypothetical protein